MVVDIAKLPSKKKKRPVLFTSLLTYLLLKLIFFKKSPAGNAWVPPHTNSHVGSTCQTTLVFPVGSSSHQAPVCRPGSEMSVTLRAAAETKPRAGTWPQAQVLQVVSLLAGSPPGKGPCCPRPEPQALDAFVTCLSLMP